MLKIRGCHVEDLEWEVLGNSSKETEHDKIDAGGR